MIRAEAHADDYKATAKFDATPWFEQASEDEIVMLARQDFGGDYAADGIAHHLEDKPGYDSLGAMFGYLGRKPTTPSGDAIGFEVRVHKDDALRWLMENRKEIFEEVRVVEGIDDKWLARLRNTEAGAPDWDSDSSWPATAYDTLLETAAARMG